VLDAVRAMAARAAREEIAARLGGDVIFERWQAEMKRGDTLEAALMAIATFGDHAAALAESALKRTTQGQRRIES
jgi:hypothetical protein